MHALFVCLSRHKNALRRVTRVPGVDKVFRSKGIKWESGNPISRRVAFAVRHNYIQLKAQQAHRVERRNTRTSIDIFAGAPHKCEIELIHGEPVSIMHSRATTVAGHTDALSHTRRDSSTDTWPRLFPNGVLYVVPASTRRDRPIAAQNGRPTA